MYSKTWPTGNEHEHEERKRQTEISLTHGNGHRVGKRDGIVLHVVELVCREKSWKEETVPISPQGVQTVVRSFEGGKIL